MLNKILLKLLIVSVSLFISQPFLSHAYSKGTRSEQADKTIRISGLVKEPDGEPAIGVSVMLKGTASGTVTDVDGNFILSAPANGTLVFSYVGFKTTEIEIQGKNDLIVVLENDAQEIDEVVVVGYGSQRKISTIGAQSGVKFVEDLKQPTATLSSVLAGRIAGVIGMQRSGEAGKDDNTQIWIRGVSTTTNTTPLILVDGIERSYVNIDPEDIASFQVLKDASATAVYGVKGANGVILIETKKGTKGKPRIKVEYTAGITSFTKLPDLADGVTYLQMANEASMNKGNTPVYTDEYIRNTYQQTDPYLYPNVNWMDQIFKDHGYNQRINVNANGGSEFAQYYVSMGYYNEGGLYKKQENEAYDGSMSFNRVNFVSNITMQVTKTTEVNLGVHGEISDYNTPYFSAQDVFGEMLKAYPTLFPTTYPDGKTPKINNGGNVRNPYAMVYRMGTNKRNTSETKTNLKIDQNLDFIVKGLSARVLVGYDSYTRNDIQRKGENLVTYEATGRDDENNLLLKRTDNLSGSNVWGYQKNGWGHRQYYFESALNYSQMFDKIHRVSGLFLFNMTDYSNTTAGTLYHSIPYKSLGIAGRGTYSYDDRYFGEVNFGYNGAENFKPGERFGFFPSFGAAWVPSNEKFFEPLTDYIQFLKFRASWGQAGNSQLEDKRREEQDYRFAWIPTVVSKDVPGFNFDKSSTASATGGIREGRPGVDVTWELSTKTNLGVDFNVWNNDLAIQFDIYKEHRENIFLSREVIPGYIGVIDVPIGNFGIVDNRGFEVSADLSKKIGAVNVMFQGNFSYNKNEWVDNGKPIRPYAWQNAKGYSLKVREGFICDGFYTEEDIANTEVAKPLGVKVQAGDLKYRDLNGDNVIDAYDIGYIGAPSVPRITYGFGTTLNWNNFTFGIFFQGVSDVSLTLSASAFKPFADEAAKGNLYANIVDRWTPENPDPNAKWPRLDYGLTTNAMNYDESSFWIKDGSYIRLKTVDFAYTIPSHITKKWHLNSMRVFLTGYNLLTFTPFDMWDVELGQDGNGMKYPNLRTFAAGFNFSF